MLFALINVSVIAQKDGDDDVIKVDSSIVVVNATITDAKGKPAAGLKQNQFKLFVDGAEQEILSFTTESTPFAAVILLDTSGSMEQRVSLARSAAMQFLDGLRTDDLTAVYNFDSKVSLIQDFSNSRDIAPGAFELKAYGMTVLNDAIHKAAQELSNRPEKRRAIVVLSDGADTRSARSGDKALKAALGANATIYTVDMSAADSNGRERMQNQNALKSFAEKSGGRFIPTPGGVAMREAFKNIVAELGRQYTLSFQPPESKLDGKWHTIELKHSNPELSIRTRKGYNAPKKSN
ncbi:MAG TPA: VWA domain-containing protein [Pyrinomonadaceae bacterium]|nr:VWA domain-containing protein [Pyrinomonadaceae bacterium]